MTVITAMAIILNHCYFFCRNNSGKNGEYMLEMFISIATVIESQNVP